jgi:hypothetical protein
MLSQKEIKMKKIVLIGVFVMIAALGVAGFAYAQADTPPGTPDPASGYGYFGGGMMYGSQGGGWGMMGRRGGFRAQATSGEYGPLHEYIIAAFADALELSPEEIESRLAGGETMWQIADSQGMSFEAFGDLMIEARTNAIQAAADADVISQEQAEWMLQRMSQRQASGYGPGSGQCDGLGANASSFGGSSRGRGGSR